MAGYAPSLYVPVYAEKPQLEKDMPTDKRKWMLHSKAQVSGRNDKNNFVVIHFEVDKLCRGTTANFHLKEKKMKKMKRADWFKLIFT